MHVCALIAVHVAVKRKGFRISELQFALARHDHVSSTKV